MEQTKIELEYIVKNIEGVKRAAEATKHLESVTRDAADAQDRSSQAIARQENVLNKGRQAILNFRKELFVFSFTVAGATAALIAMGRSSDSLGGQLDRTQDAFQRVLKNLGDLVAQSQAVNFLTWNLNGLANILQKINQFTQSKGGASKLVPSADSLNFTDALRARTSALSGDAETAKRLELQLEFLTRIQDQMSKMTGTARQDLFNAWKSYESASVQALRRSELGLKNNLEIIKSFKSEIAGAFEGGVRDPVFKFLQGEKQTGGDVLRGFQTGINSAVSNAIASALKTSLFGGGGFGNFFGNLKDAFAGKNPTTQAVDRMGERIEELNRIAEKMRDCICRTAENTGVMASRGSGMGALTATITAAKAGGLEKIGAISGAVGSIGKIFGVGGGGSIDLPNLGPRGHQGGFVGAFNTGGEVPITAQPGEFIIRKSVAQANKSFLKDFNMGGNANTGKGQNVFIIKALDYKSFDEALSSSSARERIEFQVVRALHANGMIRNSIKSLT